MTQNAHTVQVAAGSGRTAGFTLTNVGTRPATYSLTATCAGDASSCVRSPTSVYLDTTTTGRTASATITFTIPAAGDTGAVTLAAQYSTDKDSATTAVIVPVATAANAVGTILDDSTASQLRGSCLTIAVGDGAAYECGDLRLAHALPAVTTRGKTRAPTLVYNSGQAIGNALIGADVTPLPRAYSLDSVVATAKIGAVSHGRGKWLGSDWAISGSPVTRHIAVRVDTLLSTRDSTVTLNVQAWYADGHQETYTPSAAVSIVNRSASPFGAGWWLGGLEQIIPRGSDWLWIGGDGSTRLYHYVSSTKWRGDSATGPDSLIKSGSLYIRRMPNGAQVEFTSAGYDSMTVPTVGPVTTFAYDGSPGSRRSPCRRSARAALCTTTSATHLILWLP